MSADQKSLETDSVFDCHLSPDWRQMAIKNTVSSDFWSTFVGIFNVFDCRLSGVIKLLQYNSPYFSVCKCYGLKAIPFQALEVLKHFSSSTFVSVLTFISMMNTTPVYEIQKNLIFFSSVVFMNSWNSMLSWVEHEQVNYLRAQAYYTRRERDIVNEHNNGAGYIQ